MNQQIDREEVKKELRIIFHQNNEIAKPSLLNTILDLIEEQTDISYINGVTDLANHLYHDYGITIVKNDDNEIAFLGDISEDFTDDITE